MRSTPAQQDRRRPYAAGLRHHGDILLVIAAGGAVGSLGRWALAELMPAGSGEIPWSTWVANVSGAFALGLLMVFVLDVWPPTRYLRPFLGVGVLGGYTTFSTYTLDTYTLAVDGRPFAASLYLLGTLLSGLTAVWLGIVVARAAVVVRSRRRVSRGRSSRTVPVRDEPARGEVSDDDVTGESVTRR